MEICNFQYGYAKKQIKFQKDSNQLIKRGVPSAMYQCGPGAAWDTPTTTACTSINRYIIMTMINFPHKCYQGDKKISSWRFLYLFLQQGLSALKIKTIIAVNIINSRLLIFVDLQQVVHKLHRKRESS
jgi:hypothetical protein